MPKKRLPSLPKLMELFQTHTIHQLAEIYQVNEETIAKKIAQARRQHIYANPAKQQRCEQIKKMLAEGKTFPQMARILGGLNPDSLRLYAIRNGLYTPPAKKYLYAKPVGCRLCVIQPYFRGLCWQCYNRFTARKAKRWVDYPDKLLILEHPKFTVYYETNYGYTIHTQFLDTLHIYKPNELETILLDHLQREVLLTLDEAAIKRISEQVENTAPMSPPP